MKLIEITESSKVYNFKNVEDTIKRLTPEEFEAAIRFAKKQPEFKALLAAGYDFASSENQLKKGILSFKFAHISKTDAGQAISDNTARSVIYPNGNVRLMWDSGDHATTISIPGIGRNLTERYKIGLQALVRVANKRAKLRQELGVVHGLTNLSKIDTSHQALNQITFDRCSFKDFKTLDPNFNGIMKIISHKVDLSMVGCAVKSQHLDELRIQEGKNVIDLDKLPERIDILDLSESNIISLKGIGKSLRYCDKFYFSPKIQDSILGIMNIQWISTYKDVKVNRFTIAFEKNKLLADAIGILMTNYHNKADILDCKAELIEAGLGQYAKL
jgi:hypothetical protein